MVAQNMQQLQSDRAAHCLAKFRLDFEYGLIQVCLLVDHHCVVIPADTVATKTGDRLVPVATALSLARSLAVAVPLILIAILPPNLDKTVAQKSDDHLASKNDFLEP